MHRFYIVIIHPKAGVTTKQLEYKMNVATDWFRISPNEWILYTTRTAEQWTNRLRPFVDPDGRLLVCQLDVSDSQGWNSAQFWEWWNKKRTAVPPTSMDDYP